MESGVSRAFHPTLTFDRYSVGFPVWLAKVPRVAESDRAKATLVSRIPYCSYEGKQWEKVQWLESAKNTPPALRKQLGLG